MIVIITSDKCDSFVVGDHRACTERAPEFDWPSLGNFLNPLTLNVHHKHVVQIVIAKPTALDENLLLIQWTDYGARSWREIFGSCYELPCFLLSLCGSQLARGFQGSLGFFYFVCCFFFTIFVLLYVVVKTNVKLLD